MAYKTNMPTCYHYNKGHFNIHVFFFFKRGESEIVFRASLARRKSRKKLHGFSDICSAGVSVAAAIQITATIYQSLTRQQLNWIIICRSNVRIRSFLPSPGCHVQRRASAQKKLGWWTTLWRLTTILLLMRFFSPLSRLSLTVSNYFPARQRYAYDTMTARKPARYFIYVNAEQFAIIFLKKCTENLYFRFGF